MDEHKLQHLVEVWSQCDRTNRSKTTLGSNNVVLTSTGNQLKLDIFMLRVFEWPSRSNLNSGWMCLWHYLSENCGKILWLLGWAIESLIMDSKREDCGIKPVAKGYCSRLLLRKVSVDSYESWAKGTPSFICSVIVNSCVLGIKGQTTLNQWTSPLVLTFNFSFQKLWVLTYPQAQSYIYSYNFIIFSLVNCS